MLGFIDRFTGWASDLIGDFVGGVAGEAAEGVMNLIMSFWYGLIADAVASVTGFLLQAMDTTTAVDLHGGWWTSPEAQTTWRHVLAISAGLLLLFYFLQIIKGIATGDTAGLLRTVAVSLPTTVLGTLALVAVTSAILTATDDATALVTGDLGDNLGEFSALLGSADTISGAGFLGLLFALLYVLGAVVIWIQMVIRGALIYVLVMFAPLALSARVFEGARHIARRLIEIGIALILSKFAIGLTLATGAAAVAGGSTLGPEEGTSIDATSLIAGPAIMILGAFMPFVLYRLIPVFEGAAVGQGVASGPLRALSTAGGLAFAAHSLSRLAGGGRAGGAAGGAGGGAKVGGGGAAAVGGPAGAALSAGGQLAGGVRRGVASAVNGAVPPSGKDAGSPPGSAGAVAGPSGRHSPP